VRFNLPHTQSETGLRQPIIAQTAKCSQISSMDKLPEVTDIT
jgi:hypothetical protein